MLSAKGFISLPLPFDFIFRGYSCYLAHPVPQTLFSLDYVPERLADEGSLGVVYICLISMTMALNAW